MKKIFFKLFDALGMYQGEKVAHQNEQRLFENLISGSLVIGSIASVLSRSLILNETIGEYITDTIVLLVYIFFYRALFKIKDEFLRRLLSLVVYSSLLLFIGIAFYDYIGPAIWIMSALFFSMALIHSRKDMLYGYIFTTIVLLVYVNFTKPEFSTNIVYNVGLWVTMTILIFVMYGLHNIINGRYNFMKYQYEKIRQTENKYYFTLKSIGDGVITTDRVGKIEYLNPIAEEMCGFTLKEVRGNSFENAIVLLDELTRLPISNPIPKVLKTKETLHFSNHTLMISKDGVEFAIEDTASPIFDESGDVTGVVMVLRDHSYKKEKQRQIEYLSYHDQLSGLYNRRFFEEALSKLDVTENLPLAVMFIDVNGLKVINDAFGHQVGDDLIKRVAEVLNLNKRELDIISRIGGDEFVILMPKTEQLYLNHYTKEVQSKLKKHEIMGLEVSVSFGWDIKKTAGQDVFDCIKNAEDRMYQSKIFYSTSKRNDIIKSISSALALKSSREEEHSMRVGELCFQMGSILGLSESECQTLKVTGELHDIGKIAIDESLLNKPEALSKDEWELIKQHAETGYRLLNTSKEFYVIAEYVKSHHERWDGTGYPDGVKGLDIPLNTRILSLVDAYDAMTNEQFYARAKTRDEAIAELRRCSGTQFDPELTRIFIDNLIK